MSPSTARVLLVAGDQAYARLVSSRIRDAAAGEFDVSVAGSLAAAIADAGERPPDAVLLDLDRPDSQESGSLAQLRAALIPGTPIVVLTGLEDPTAEREAMQSGAQDYLIKGHADGDVIARALRHALERSRWDRRRTEDALRNSEMQLRQARKMEAVGRLAGGIAHDFNNLLTAIFGYADLLLDALGDGPGSADVQQIKHAAERAAALTRQLLAFSRKQLMQPQRVNLNDTITNILKLLKRLLPPDIALQVLADPALEAVRADPGQMEQVLINLCANARDAMPEGGRLLMTTSNVVLTAGDIQRRAGLEPGRYVCLAVEDNGKGMPEEIRRHIFEPFFTTKEIGNGTGLGLSTVHGIVKESGGWIDIDSETGRGSTFTIYLPRWTDDERAAVDSGALAPLSLLLVEVDDAVRHLAAENLRRHGHRVVEARDAREALPLGADGRLDLVVTALRLPDGDGRELVRRLQQGAPDLKALFLCSYDESTIGPDGLAAPGTCLEKPFTPRALLDAVRNAAASPIFSP